MIENTKNQDTIETATNEAGKVTVSGGCHCGAVKFIAQVDPKQTLLDCNCSLCSMTGHLHMMATHNDFVLISGQEQLSSYRFNTQQANHLFCSKCGIKSFYQPRSHPDCWSINARCLDEFDASDWHIETYDGQNWEQAKAELTQKESAS